MSRFRITWQRMVARLRGWVGSDKFLCDSCKLNYGDVCTRSERPNAVVCPEYAKKG